MFTKIFILTFLAAVLAVQATNPPETPPIRKPPVTPVNPAGGETCPAPTPEILRCMRQWACQYLIRLDLRCLLNLNGNPLLGGLLGGGGGSATPGGGGGGGVGGILDGILG